MPAAVPGILPAGDRSDLRTGSVYFVGTATVLLRYAGFTIMTDPNFLHRGDHVQLGFGLRATRLTEPALAIDQLPPLDLVVLSHLHGDHFDHIAAEQLDKDLPIVTTPQAASVLRRTGVNSPLAWVGRLRRYSGAELLPSVGFRAVRALQTWQGMTVRKRGRGRTGDVQLRIVSMPGRHGPLPASLLMPQVMGSLLDFQTAAGQRLLRVYISGDTLVYDQLKQIPLRFPDIDLALVHLGGTRVLGLLVTMDAKQGVQALRIIQPHHAIPIHFNDYDVFKSPLDDFRLAVREAGLADRVQELAHGESYIFQVADARLRDVATA